MEQAHSTVHISGSGLRQLQIRFHDASSGMYLRNDDLHLRFLVVSEMYSLPYEDCNPDLKLTVPLYIDLVLLLWRVTAGLVFRRKLAVFFATS